MFLEAVLILSVALLMVFFILFLAKGRSEIVHEKSASKPRLPYHATPDPAELFMNAKSCNGFFECMEILSGEYLEHGMCSFWCGPMKMVLVWKPELVEAVANCPGAQGKGPLYKLLFNSIADGVFISPGGREWKELRKPFAQSMAKKHLENDYFNNFVFRTHEFIDFMKQNREGKCFDIGKDISALVFDIFTGTILGVHSNELKDRKWTYCDLVEELYQNSISERIKLNHYIMRFITYFKKLLFKMFNLMTSFNSFSKRSVGDKSSLYRNNKSLTVTERIGRNISAFYDQIFDILWHKSISLLLFYLNEIHFGLTKEGRLSIKIERKLRLIYEWVMEERMKCTTHNSDNYTDFLMKRREKRNLSVRKMLNELSDVMAAGSDTSPTVLSSFLLFIAMHPEVQQELFNEQQEIFGNSDRDPSIEDLPKMKYLESVLKETLRHIGPPVIAKVAEDDCVIGNHKVSRGSSFILYLRRTHRSPKYFEKPEEFYPDHFLPEVDAKRPWYAFVPFGFGPRKCPGFFYAEIMMKVSMSMVVRNFTLKTPVTMETIKYNYSLLMAVREGYCVELSSRKSN